MRNSSWDELWMGPRPYWSLKLTVTVMITGTGTPLSSVGE
jgi:hypothetical protein